MNIKFLRKLFNIDKVAGLNAKLEIYRIRNEQLESQVKELEDLRLTCKIQKMYIDDDAAIDELLAAHKEKTRLSDRESLVRSGDINAQAEAVRRSRSFGGNMFGQQSGLFEASFF